MRQVEFEIAAEVELNGAIDYLNDQVEGLGAEFRAYFARALIRIAENPEHYPRVSRRSRFRKHLLRRYRHHVYYEIHRTHILIVAIAHTSRWPGYWRSRRRFG